MQIRPFELSDIPAVKTFADRTIGTNYFSTEEFKAIYKKSIKEGRQCSMVLAEGPAILGIRITYPPGNWEKGKGQGLNPEKWGVPLKDTAYFQSIFLDPSLTGQGWGGKMSAKAIEILRELGAKAVVTHSWKESPNNSSRKYLEHLGFEFVVEHPLYWTKIDYDCTGCSQKPCVCTAEEMILKLDR